MDLMELFSILKQGENTHTEFKVDFTEQAHQIAKELAALANSGGGIFLMGVADDGTPKGIPDSSKANKVVERLTNIARSCSPPLLPEIDKVILSDDITIVYARVPDSAPCLYEGKIFIRVGSSSVQASGGAELESLLKNVGSFHRNSITVPPLLFSPPPIKGFKGRTEEIKRLVSLIESNTTAIIIIEGISGIGKTALAAHLATHIKQYGYTPFWIECRADTSFDSIISALSVFAYSNGEDVLASIVEDVTVSIEEHIARIAAVIAESKYLLFFDDFQFVTDPIVNRLLQKMAERSIKVKLLLMCRQRPRLISAISPMLLAEETLRTGLHPEACTQFLKDCGVNVSEDIAHKIWELTGEGHPKALEIFVARARNYQVTELLSRLPIFREELTNEWLTPLMSELTQEQRNFAIDLSVFDRPISLNGLEWLYPEKDTNSIIKELEDRFILDRVGENLRMHLLIREFCYALIPDKRSKNIWAAEYYLDQSTFEHTPDTITDLQIDARIAAWTHFIKAEEHIRATEELYKLRLPLMNRGQYEQVMFLIEQTPLSPEKEDWYTIDKARIMSLWGDFEAAVDLILPLISSPNENITRESVIVLSTIYNEHGKGRHSKELLEKYHERFFTNVRSHTRRRFLSRLVEAYSLIGELEQAFKWAKKILDFCEAVDEEISGAISLRQMATILKAQKNFDTALSLCELSYGLLKKHSRLRDAAITELVMASIYKELDNHENALHCLQNSLHAFISMGDRRNSTLARKQMKELTKQ